MKTFVKYLLIFCGVTVVTVVNIAYPNASWNPIHMLASQPDLQIHVHIFDFVNLNNITVTNNEKHPLTIEKITINDKYVADHFVGFPAGQGAAFSPQRLETGETTAVFLNHDWPLPVYVTVETSEGTYTEKITLTPF